MSATMPTNMAREKDLCFRLRGERVADGFALLGSGFVTEVSGFGGLPPRPR